MEQNLTEKINAMCTISPVESPNSFVVMTEYKNAPISALPLINVSSPISKVNIFTIPTDIRIITARNTVR